MWPRIYLYYHAVNENGWLLMWRTDVSINEMKPDQTAYISSLKQLDPKTAKKLRDLGMTKGQHIRFIQRAPLGDPVWIELRGYQLAFSSKIANNIIVEVERGGASS